MRTLLHTLCLFLLMQTLSLAADFSGKYGNDKIKVNLLTLPGTGTYFGSVSIGDKGYPLTAEVQQDKLVGTFDVDGTAFPISATLDGTNLKLTSGGREHVLAKLAGDPPVQPQPPAQQANPLEPTNNANPQPTPQPQPEPAPPPQAAALPVDEIVAKLKALPAGAANPNREWTILVHLNADNDLEKFGLQDLNEMEKGLVGNTVEILALVDRCAGFDKTDGDWQGARLYRVKPDANMSAIASELLLDLGELNMGDQAILSAFVEGSLKAYPARQTALVMWNHGGGWRSMSNDFLSPGFERGDDVKLPELRGALETALPAANVKKLSIIGFDMCLMAQAEVATELSDLAEVMVASEAVEPGYGWPYDVVVPAFSKGTGGSRRIGTDVVTAFNNFYKTVRKEKIATLSAVDLSLTGEFNAKLNALIDKIQPTMAQAWPTLARSVFYGEQFCDRDDYKKGVSALQSVDVLDVLKRLRHATPNFPAEAEYRDFMAVADRFVLMSANSERHRLSNGVAIYAPVQEKLVDPKYGELKFATASKWPAAMAAMHAQQKLDTAPPVITNIRMVDGDDKPINAFQALSGHRYRVTVTGKNIIYTQAWTGRRSEANGGVVLDVKSFVFDAEWLKRAIEGEQVAHDVDLIMPKYQDGVNELKDDFPGIGLVLSNGKETRDCTLDGTDLSKNDEWRVRVMLKHPDLGPDRILAMMFFDNTTFRATRILAEMPQPDGTTRLRQIEPWPELEVFPVSEVVTDNDEIKLIAMPPFKWENGLKFLVKLMDPGDYEAILVAETMSGVSGKARAKFKVEASQELAKASESWKQFKMEMMPGKWDVTIPAANGPVLTWKLTLDRTDDPRVFVADVLTMTDNSHDRWVIGVDLDLMPHLRIFSFDGDGEISSMVLGPALFGLTAQGEPALRVLLVNLGGIPTDWRRTEGAPVAPNNPNNPNPPVVNNPPANNPNPPPNNPNPPPNNPNPPPNNPAPPPVAENEERFKPVDVPDPRPLQIPQMQPPQQGNPWGF